MTVRVLSFHASYGCHNRGRCCTSNWPIGVDATERITLEAANETGILTPARPHFPLFADEPPVAGSSLLASTGGRCVFHDDNAAGGCRIHRALGHAALPLACRQFPRQSVRDARGVSITLSHYCPTADELLRSASSPTAIVTDAPAFPAGAEYVGLTADSDLPPLLHARLAMDWENWSLFEELSVSLLCNANYSLTRLGLAVEAARGWTVERGPLSDHLRTTFANAAQAEVRKSHMTPAITTQRTVDALAAVPHDWRPAAAAALSSQADEPLNEGAARRFLASHAFANWSAYQGDGLRTWFRSVETAACLLEVTGDPGRTDLVLRHLADSATLITRWNAAERTPAVDAPG